MSPAASPPRPTHVAARWPLRQAVPMLSEVPNRPDESRSLNCTRPRSRALVSVFLGTRFHPALRRLSSLVPGWLGSRTRRPSASFTFGMLAICPSHFTGSWRMARGPGDGAFSPFFDGFGAAAAFGAFCDGTFFCVAGALTSASGAGVATFGASTFGASTFGASTFGASTFAFAFGVIPAGIGAVFGRCPCITA